MATRIWRLVLLATLLNASCTDSPTENDGDAAPDVVLLGESQNQPIGCTEANLALSLGWRASDADGRVEAVRYLVAKVGEAQDECLDVYEYEATQPILNGDYDDLWSEWIPYDPGIGYRGWPGGVSMPSLPETEIDAKYLLAVQAMDDSGLVTDRFIWGRNVRHVALTNHGAPLVTVKELSSNWSMQFKVYGTAPQLRFDRNDQIKFRWTTDHPTRFSYVESYRYGWNVSEYNDPDDRGWRGKPGEVTETPARWFSLGHHTLTIMVVNNSDLATVVQIPFEVR